jgi:hypothetical protein
MTFWFGMALFVPWQFIVYVCIYRAIKNQPDDELENSWLIDPQQVTADALPEASR